MGNTMIDEKKNKYRFNDLLGTIPISSFKSEKEALARALEVGYAQLNRILREDSEPSATQMLRFAEYFNVSVDELYYKEEKEISANERSVIEC